LRERYRIGIVSNFYGNLQAVCDEAGLTPSITAAVDSTLVGYKKPDPRIFQAALDALRASAAEAVFVGDSLRRDMAGAREMGMRHVWLRARDAAGNGDPCCPEDTVIARSPALQLDLKRRMTETSTCWGIFEIEHCRAQADDAEILKATGRRPERPERDSLPLPRPSAHRPRAPAYSPSRWRGPAALERLRKWESRGVCVVNSPRSVANTHRERTIPLLEGRRIPMPKSRLLDCGRPLPRGKKEDRLSRPAGSSRRPSTRRARGTSSSPRSRLRSGMRSIGSGAGGCRVPSSNGMWTATS
jgi:hypothetical protein